MFICASGDVLDTVVCASYVGAGYSRDGSVWLRKHAAARERIAAYQQQVCSALRFIASGSAPDSSHPAQRLAFINETRHA